MYILLTKRIVPQCEIKADNLGYMTCFAYLGSRIKKSAFKFDVNIWIHIHCVFTFCCRAVVVADTIVSRLCVPHTNTHSRPCNRAVMLHLVMVELSLFLAFSIFSFKCESEKCGRYKVQQRVKAILDASHEYSKDLVLISGSKENRWERMRICYRMCLPCVQMA